jgi:hypothetical protein
MMTGNTSFVSHDNVYNELSSKSLKVVEALSDKKTTQKEIVKEAIKETPKSIKEIAAETKIKEPNIRRILGVGAKEGTFERVDDGVYTSYKEVYFGQSDANDCDTEVYTFQSDVVDNKLGDYAQVYLGGATNNVLILSNNVFSDYNTFYNQIGDKSINNHFYGNVSGNKIGNDFSGNIILGDCYNNTITNIFQNNFFQDLNYNSFFAEFLNNISFSYNFRYNTIKTPVSDFDFTSATHVYAKYNCELFLNQAEVARLSYYNSSDVLTINDVDA